MNARQVIARRRARQDVDEAIAHYLGEGAEQTALDFVDALERAYDRIGRHPGSGSPRYAHELNLPGLRDYQVVRFPYLIFYIECADHSDVWRVLHAERNVAAWMQASDAP